MSDPFRDSEASALARIEELERENERLAAELEEARALVGENHQAFVKNLEDKLGAFNAENEYLKKELATARATDRYPSYTALKTGFFLFVGLAAFFGWLFNLIRR
jgi:hypothetical protein